MDTTEKEKQKGVAALFDHIEIKVFLKNYLIMIGIVEAFIFFVSFIGQLGPDNTPFPWKSYFFAAFTIPVAITFLLGILVMGFNRYLYGHPDSENSSNNSFLPEDESGGYIYKLKTFLNFIQQLPFLLSLLLLGIFAGFIYKLDAIVLFIGKAGEKTAQYLLIALGVLLAIASVIGLVWMVLNYKLKKSEFSLRHQYRHEVVKQLGLIIMDDDTVIDKDGRVISKGSAKSDSNALLPDLQENLKKNIKAITRH